jgi:flagellar biosynthesis/type III secretory pathway protein FliH
LWHTAHQDPITMAKKNQAAKTAPAPAPAPRRIAFDPRFGTMLNDEHTRARQSPTTRIQWLQAHENDIYEEIVRRGREEGFQKAQDDYQGLLETTQQMMYQVGKQEGREAGYEEGLTEGEERGRKVEREAWETSHGPGNCVEPRCHTKVI